MITQTVIENSLIIAGESFWLFSAASQLVRIAKTRNRLGLSAPSQALNAAGNVAWIIYFLSQDLIVPVITNASMLVLTLMVLAYTLSNKKQFLKGLMAIAIIAPITSYLLITHPGISGWIGVAYNAIASTPWLFRVIRTKKTSGISERSLYFTIGAILCTFTYGLLIGSAPLLTGCTFLLGSTLVIMTYYYRYRHAT